MTKVAIGGSRSIGEVGSELYDLDRDYVFYHLDKMFGGPEMRPSMYGRDYVVLSGGARGVDTLVREWAEGEGIDFVLFKPYHMLDPKAEYTSRYFFIRNKQMVDNADEVVVFWDGVSNGARSVINYSRKRGKSLTIIEPDWREQ